MSNSLDPDQTRCFVRPDLASNCLQNLSADDIKRVKGSIALRMSIFQLSVTVQ